MLKVIPLGGMGRVTQNMFLYEYDNEILIVDCGIGFPDVYMPGVDVLIPDYRYLLRAVEQGKHIVGLVFSHGHDDHIAAAPYILHHLPEFPLFGSPLTARFAEKRLQDAGLSIPVTTIPNSDVITLSENFSFQYVKVTHSVPDTRHVVIRTPEGIVYHGSDFKIDPHPVDNEKTDFDLIKKIGDEGVMLMNIDCLRIENDTATPSETTVGPALREIMSKTKGKYIATIMSSHIHRIQQIIDASAEFGRKITFIGRSVEQNVDVALELGKLRIPKGMKVDKRDLQDVAAGKLTVVIAGSQGQEGSSLVRAVYGEHQMLRIEPEDTVVFSADAIPGNEMQYYGAIDELSRNRVHVVYPAVNHAIHRSGHASLPEQVELLKAVHPQYVMPVGGNDRHRFKFWELAAQPMGFAPDRVLMPKDGEVIGFEQGKPHVVDTITLQPQIVDGLGVGDVGPIVLADRLVLGQAGIVVIVIPKKKGELQLDQMSVVSRGFIFMREATEVVEYIKEAVAAVATNERKKKIKDDDLERMIEKRLARKLYQIIKREPMIVAEVVPVS